MNLDSKKQENNGSALSPLPDQCNHDTTYCKQMGFLYSPHSDKTELLSVTKLPKIAQPGPLSLDNTETNCYSDADSTLINSSPTNCYATTDSTLCKTFITNDYMSEDSTLINRSTLTQKTDFVNLLNKTHIAETIQLLSEPIQSSDLTEIYDNDTLIANLFVTAESSNLSTQINRPMLSINEINYFTHNNTVNSNNELEKFTFFGSSNSPFSQHFLANFTVNLQLNCVQLFRTIQDAAKGIAIW